ncbi:multiple sugar transport system substrate-binding protein [Clostridium saccharoperbutylacetonicum]|uniref:Carbohydrate ABC transporter substrate-binding protein, CUT1 family n=1 Tax=Clostridium saccharoperbutylacetonicum N1-4(HMT) TaxID=931276 RepID=M1M0K6_9CLOT|nr:ABC transporter substrate-binding protein [Clostridium saccharoperbutylacetonicum]AGF59110.1 carbohydrate ABC transporter substrate-binding protein, CUT1 family [Clostridium saccharoperbutylacetonicum N1-4(HMT)]NRT60102.1 multiple sugar transport system substrate-binding protein [Clostridium saccharoperbutylacetonicum]NSB23414.1 multiple sugar transport system substrate-binding protein [Clostridium saccharoperbutylacetonicum]NSB42784.1 multiple sugar transport system substrate-binding protei
MNKFVKKICAVALISIVSGSLAACGNSGVSAKGPVKTASGKIQVEYWYGLGGKLGDNMEKIIKEFNDSQDKYEVKGVAQDKYDTTFKNLQAGIAAKKSPAVALLEPDKAVIFARKDLLINISDYTNKDADFKADNYLESFLETGKYQDKLIGFPAFGTTQLLYYNKQAFKDAGISEDKLKTWTGLAEAAKKLTKKDGDEVSFYGWEPMWGQDNLIDAALSNGGKILSDDGKQVLINSPEWIEAWDSFRKWIHEDKIMRIHSGGQGWEYWYATVDDAMKDKAAGYTGSSGDQGDLDFNKLAAFEQPAFKEGKKSSPIAQARVLVIPKEISDEEKQGAYEFIKYFTSAKVSAQWSMASGYISVNKGSTSTPEFTEYVKKNPQALVPTAQAAHATKVFIDPTDGKIIDALKVAADKVEIENVSAKDALDEAQKTAQEAVDSVKN